MSSDPLRDPHALPDSVAGYPLRKPLRDRAPGAFTDPTPPASWVPTPPPASPPPRPLMPPSEHEAREPRLYSAASANDTDALQEVTNCPWDWHGDELVRAAGHAARHGALDALRWLLAHGVNATATTARNFNREISADVGSEPLMLFAAQGGSTDAAELLLNRGAAINASDGTGRTPLHAAAAHGHLPMLRWLLAHGADINALALEGTPLAGAVSCDQPEIVRELLAAGADPARKHDWCPSALDAAKAQPHLLALLTPPHA